MAVNPYNKDVFILDELYETQTSNTSVSIVWPKLMGKMVEANPGVDPKGDEWYRGYDEAAAWFSNEVWDQFNASFIQTQKKDSNKEDGISLIKDLLIKKKIIISSRCKNLIHEMENYVKDKNGRIPKKNDHLIDCLRYALYAAGYSISAISEPVREDNGYRGYSIDHDLFTNEGDW